MKVAIVANGAVGSAAWERGERIAAQLGPGAVVLGRRAGRWSDLVHLRRELARARPAVVYTVDLAVVPLVATLLGAPRAKLVVDTGDAPADFFVQIGAPLPVRLAARVLERVGYRRAALVVVRGDEHQAALAGRTRRTVVIPDGVDLEVITPVEDAALRRHLGLDDVFTVGISGRFTWYPELGGGMGWELVHAMAAGDDVSIHAVLIGDGPGLPSLLALAGELGVADRVHVLGRIPYDELARHLGLCDVCLLTQTNDPSSRIRTTGKLPVYLAAGRFIVASRVGTAARVLPDDMLLDYDGRWDDDYPRRLAKRLKEVAASPDRAERGLALRPLAEQFAYPDIANRAAAAIRSVVG